MKEKRICVNCGKEFISNNWNKKFCCRECYLKYTYEHRKMPQRKVSCSWCHKEFTTSRPLAKYCCHECKMAFRQIRKRISSLDSIRNLHEELETQGKDFRFPRPNEDLNGLYGLGE